MSFDYTRHIFTSALILLAISLPLSPFLLSFAQIILILNWLWEGKFPVKWKYLIKNKGILIFTILYFIHLMGMFYSSDLPYGFHDLKIKLPLLILPIILGTSQRLTPGEFRLILGSFCTAVLISTFISAGKLFNWWGPEITDIRDISAIISHIRLALMVNLSIFILYWFLKVRKDPKIYVACYVGIIWFIFFLFLLKSLTGILIFAILAMALLVKIALKSKDMMARWFITVGILMLFLLSTGYLSYAISRFNYVEKTEPGTLETKTIRGNLYINDTLSKDTENGHLVWINYCEKELKPAWNHRSKLDYTGKDLKGQDLRYTLIRYLTSRGLTKDSLGICSLTNADIHNIESGIANIIYTEKFSLYPRIYELLWELRHARTGGDPSGHSFTQRFHYMNTALNIIKDHPWWGVGTGDVGKAFEEKYKQQHSALNLRWRLRAHDQLVTFFLTFGVMGGVIAIISLMLPIIICRKTRSFLMVIFLAIALLSFLNEDTLETQAGVSFFAFFYILFLLYPENEKEYHLAKQQAEQDLL